MAIADIIEKIIMEHFALETGLKKIAVFSENNDSELRLVEVNEDALPTGQVEPFVFAPNEELSLPIFIADVTPDEWEEICAGQISLPEGWPHHPIQIIDRNQEK